VVKITKLPRSISRHSAASGLGSAAFSAGLAQRSSSPCPGSSTSTSLPAKEPPAVVSVTPAPLKLRASSAKLSGASPASGRPASFLAMSRLTLLENATPCTFTAPPSTTSVFSASSRCPAGTGRLVSPAGTTPARSK